MKLTEAYKKALKKMTITSEIKKPSKPEQLMAEASYTALTSVLENISSDKTEIEIEETKDKIIIPVRALKLLNEDLKASLTTALSNELKNITETDKSLISITEYNIPPYDVSVKSAAMVKFNDAGELIRESKVIIQCKIVPVGALRDIDLGIIVI